MGGTGTFNVLEYLYEERRLAWFIRDIPRLKKANRRIKELTEYRWVIGPTISFEVTI